METFASTPALIKIWVYSTRGPKPPKTTIISASIALFLIAGPTQTKIVLTGRYGRTTLPQKKNKSIRFGLFGVQNYKNRSAFSGEALSSRRGKKSAPPSDTSIVKSPSSTRSLQQYTKKKIFPLSVTNYLYIPLINFPPFNPPPSRPRRANFETNVAE